MNCSVNSLRTQGDVVYILKFYRHVLPGLSIFDIHLPQEFQTPELFPLNWECPSGGKGTEDSFHFQKPTKTMILRLVPVIERKNFCTGNFTKSCHRWKKKDGIFIIQLLISLRQKLIIYLNAFFSLKDAIWQSLTDSVTYIKTQRYM